MSKNFVLAVALVAPYVLALAIVFFVAYDIRRTRRQIENLKSKSSGALKQVEE